MIAPADLIVRADDIEEFSLPGQERVFASQCLVDRDGVQSRHLNINRFTLRAGQHIRGLSHPVGNDECYYVLRGRARLSLGGDPLTGQGGIVRDIEPDTVVFIPGGTYHALDNIFDEDLVLLTIWPEHPEPGANHIYDARRRAWGTSFRKKSSVGEPAR